MSNGKALPAALTKDWPNWAVILWGRMNGIEEKVNRIYIAGLVLGATLTAVLFLTSDADSIVGRLARLIGR